MQIKMIFNVVMGIICLAMIASYFVALAVTEMKSAPKRLPPPHRYQVYIDYKGREITVDGVAVPIEQRVDDVTTEYYWSDENFNVGEVDIRNIAYTLRYPLKARNEVEICDYLDFGDNKKTTFKGYVSDGGTSIIKY